MNKKLFTLAAALMMGSAFTVNAQTNELKNGATLDGSTWFYLATAPTVSTVDGVTTVNHNARVFIGAGALENADPIATILNGTIATGIDVTGSTTDLESQEDQDVFLWKVSASELNGTYYYTFTNKDTGKVLAFKDASNVATGKDYMGFTKLTWDGAAKNKYINSAEDAATGLNYKVTTDGSYGITTGGELSNTGLASLKLYTVDHTPVDFADLNDFLGDGFALSFPDAKPQPTSNIFDQKMTAVQALNIDGVKDGIYLVLSAPKNGITNDFKFASKAAFMSSTMIAVDPAENFGLSGYSRASGYGFDFKCPSLKNVESKNVIKDGKTSSPNAVRPSRVGTKTKEPCGQTSNGRSKTQDSSSKSCGSCAAYQIK